MINKKLPDAEFTIMKAMWAFKPPVTSAMLIEKLQQETGKAYKAQTLHTLLGRLEERGFLKSYKQGKERFFTPLIDLNSYLEYETQSFIQQYYGGSRLNLINAMYQGDGLSDTDVKELMKIINKRRK